MIRSTSVFKIIFNKFLSSKLFDIKFSFRKLLLILKPSNIDIIAPFPSYSLLITSNFLGNFDILLISE